MRGLGMVIMERTEKQSTSRRKSLAEVVDGLIFQFSDLEEESLIQADLLFARCELLKFVRENDPETGLKNLIHEVCSVFHAFLNKSQLSISDLWTIQDSLKVLLAWSKTYLEDEKKSAPDSIDEKAKSFFMAWFRNKMAIVFMRLESDCPMPELARQKTLFFLDEMEHHFGYVALRGNPFDHLKRFFEDYAYVTGEERLKALHFAQILYEAYGLKLDPGIVKCIQAKWKGKEASS
jgi:hypothetical protein